MNRGGVRFSSPAPAFAREARERCRAEAPKARLRASWMRYGAKAGAWPRATARQAMVSAGSGQLLLEAKILLEDTGRRQV